MKRINLIAIALVLGTSLASAQVDSTKTEKVKKGFNIGGLPVIAYDTDLGFEYGLLVNLFHYGDGSTYPQYRHSLYA